MGEHQIESLIPPAARGTPSKCFDRLRLALLSLLSGVEEAEFTWLRAKTEATDGNLGAQLLKLEEAGYVAVEKKFVMRKPQTRYRITENGRQALTEYVRALKQLLGPAIDM